MIQRFMASPGNPNQQPQHHHQQQTSQFDLQHLFKPSSNPPPFPSNPPILNSSPSFLHSSSSSSSPPSSSYHTPSSSSYPPPTGIYPYNPHYLPYQTHLQQQQQPQEQPRILPHLLQMHVPPRPMFQSPSPSSSPLIPSSPNPSNNSSGARLMALFGTQQNPSPSNPEPTQSSSVPTVSEFAIPANPTLLPSSPSAPTRMLSSKLPKGRHLIGDNVVYDIDVRLPGEVQPQLEVTPITKYASDPGLVLGRQIAVNRSYICYGLKLGAIRVLNINTALRYLLRGHTQRVTDMAFFAEDLHLLASASTDGRIFVWKINEGPDEEDKPQITGKVIIALQISGVGESVHPRVCWHPHKQEILMVAIGNRILKIDTMKVGKGESFSAEEPLKCSIDKLIDGVQLVGKHDGDVTELSMCQWMKSRLASASTDGTVKIWEERKASPLAVLRPHDGNPVNSVTFLTAPHRPDHIVLITAGPLNREVKIWVSDNDEGWLLPSDSESWNCIQTLDIKSSSEANPEDAFFNQVVALNRAGLFLLANSKKNTIYAVHIEYGLNPTATRMDYIAEFTVTMPILSLTGTSDSLPDGEHIVQIYCVQTQAIQQYALNLSQCLPPPLDNIELEKTAPNRSRAFDGSNIEVGNMPQVHSSNSEAGPIHSLPVSLPSSDISGSPEGSASGTETKPRDVPSHNGTEHISTASPPLPLSPRLSRKLSDFKSPSNNIETTSLSADHSSEQTYLDCSVEQRVESEKDGMRDVPASVDSLRKNDKENEASMASNTSTMFKHPTHLVTPSEIFSTAPLSSENSHTSQGINVAEAKVQDVADSDAVNAELEVKVVGETNSNQEKTESDRERDAHTTIAEKKEKLFYSQASDLGIQMARETCSIEGVHQTGEMNNNDAPDRTCNPAKGESQDMSKVVTASLSESETTVAASQSPAPSAKGGNSEGSTMEAVLPQLSTMQEMLGQLISMQKEMQKQMNVMVSVPITKEGKRLEGSFGRNMERVVKANSDALWARLLEENAKQEKLEQDRAQQITNLISNYVNKDLSAQLEKTIKKEISSIGTTVARSITQIIEKTISSTVMDSFQKGVGDRALNQLEKSVSSKLEATVARQIQAQFQTSGKLALQEALKSSLEASMIPAFEMSCKAMFEQIDVAFQNGIVKHTTAIQQQYDSTHSPLVMSLRDTINSASSITQTLSGQLADGLHKLSEIAATSKVADSSVTQISNGLHEIAEDPTKELSRLISERKFEEAFTGALLRSDVSIVSWLCSQVDLAGILSMGPLPLSQGVILSLLQQLSCDLNAESPRKLAWMTDVAAAINPADPSIAVHVRPILEQVYQILGHHRALPTTSSSEASAIRLLMHVINSVLLSCK
ncbi:LOW QUALITY PROTEIN: enhancer of mRNA-decapping protein 4-like [Neltuma alba]|uniref:LOW QUALITY PROTEIN: enhancer of mRNA-decapping protein 4-like n=1 Tax=Neltuma alba TaxID=207710 RepID=UPI0010A47BCF|nr:LOW QUALITY PROTEIN: enhancer of mRNA-decapping protein 4-like [Prosopis alba]